MYKNRTFIPFFFLTLGLSFFVWASKYNARNIYLVSKKQYAVNQVDSLGDSLKNRISDRYGDPYSNEEAERKVLLPLPDNIKTQAELDTAFRFFNIYEKVGEINYRNPSRMTFEEYSRYEYYRSLKDYWRSKSVSKEEIENNTVGEKRLIPKIYVGKAFGRIFGGNYVDIRPTGTVLLDFGGRVQRVDNPSLPVVAQRNGQFLFNQQISLGLNGKIGEKGFLTVNWDSKAAFDFDNVLKFRYDGSQANPEDIIQGIEVGNVSMPLTSTLIPGVQNLFGFKTKLRFGKLYLTALASSQRGRTEEITLRGGAQRRNFEIRAHDYDENKHFFLSQFFRDNYEASLSKLPFINSGITVTRVEVYVTNRINTTQNLRNIVGLMDLAEGTPFFQANPNIGPGLGGPARNEANLLYGSINGDPQVRDANNASLTLENNYGLSKGNDFEFVKAARKLEVGRDFQFHPELGYVSLNFPLRIDDAIAVAYEYTFKGQTFKVGELTEDYQNFSEDKVILLKLLKHASIKTSLPVWNLMMKNIYSLNANSVAKENFQMRVIYRDDQSGVDNPSLHEGINLKNTPLLEVFGLDALNPNLDPPKDGNFDFIDRSTNSTYKPVTIDALNGRLIFPVLEPFGTTLKGQFIQPQENPLIDKYVFQELYSSTKNDAEQLFSEKNKFFLKGSFQSAGSTEIMLPGINIAEGSVNILAGGTPLSEGADFTVDYSLGRVRITNQGILSSSKDIVIRFERSDLFSFQRRSLTGARIDYAFDRDFSMGATLLHYNERPLNNLTRVNIGSEPIRNTMMGFDLNMKRDSRVLTRIIDKLPFISTKETSSVNLTAEVAGLIPGHPGFIDKDGGTSYIDDFEGAKIPFDLTSSPTFWKISSTPQLFPEAKLNTLDYSKHRARLAWYNVDNLFYQSGGNASRPANITDQDMLNHYVRAVPPQEIFPNKDVKAAGFNQLTLDLAYFPHERGQYNYNTDVDAEGFLKNPADNWAGLTRAITTNVDFDNANVEYINFWLMDPFLTGENGKVLDGKFNTNNITGGEVYFNLGSISEDVMKDNARQTFENGFPGPGQANLTEPTIWGKVPTQQYVTSAFDNDPAVRTAQDIGFDGLNDDEERTFFAGYLNALPPAVKAIAEQDPSSDNFNYYLGQQNDAQNLKIVQRYKQFNGLQGNSPPNTGNQGFVPASTNLPDNEDLNLDNTVSDLDEYYQYKLELKPGMKVGDKYIVDKIVRSVNGEPVTWFQFRIPIRQFDEKVGNIEGFKTMKFMRVFLTKFTQPVVLRLAQFQLVSSPWRRYPERITNPGDILPPVPPDFSFDLSAVNIEENGYGTAEVTPYVLPPGVIRDQDNNTQSSTLRLNEQSIQLCLNNLPNKDARAAFRNLNLDFLNYKRVKMYLHAQTSDLNTKDNEITAFLRFGTDFTENYYEIEVPLKLTPNGTFDPTLIWPEENNIDVPFDALYSVKNQRNTQNFNVQLPFSQPYNQYRLTVRGNPDLSTALVSMIGVRNPNLPNDDLAPKSVCIWANELRVTDFDQNAGWAAALNLNTKLADFATVTASGRYISPGFGTIGQRISQRSRRTGIEASIAANVNLHKIFSQRTGLSIPMFVSYDYSGSDPLFDPLDPDIRLQESLNRIAASQGKTAADLYKKKVTERTVRRSISFNNVRKSKTRSGAKKHLYDVENFSLSYAYNDIQTRNTNIDDYLFKNRRAGVTYDYSFSVRPFEPFRKAKSFKSPYLQWIKNINLNLIPSSISVRADLERRFIQTQFRNNNLTTDGILPLYEKLFTFNRFYNVRWNLARSLSLDYSAVVNTIVDEPFGALDTKEKRDTVWSNLKNFGRKVNFNQTISAAYNLPLNKIPIFDWLNADLRYGINYTWLSNSKGITDTKGEPLGNFLSNARDRSIDARADLTRLYRKSKFFKKISDNRPVPSVPGVQTGGKEVKERQFSGFLRGMVRLLTALKSANFSYSVQEDTYLPGYLPPVDFLGLSTVFSSPGTSFVLGGQDPGIRRRAAAQAWLSRSTFLNTPFRQSVRNTLRGGATLEPLRDFKVQIDLSKTTGTDYQEIFRLDEITQEYRSFNPLRTGNFAVSFISFGTSFKRDDKQNNSSVFENFVAYRSIIKDRLEADNPNIGNYGLNSQDVLIPAFLAAYTGRSPGSVRLSPFPKFPLPNWRIDYSGLNKLPTFTKLFSSFSISHAYSSTYEVGSYVSSLVYTDPLLFELTRSVSDYPLPFVTDGFGIYVPVFVTNGVFISERFSPLIGVDFRTKNNLRMRFEYRKERMLMLNLSNAQVTETGNKDIVLGIGFVKQKLALPFRVSGKKVVLKNDTEFRLDLILRDSKIIQRKIDEPDVITGGNLNFQLRPTISYMVSQRLNALIYYEHTVNSPRLSNSFKTVNTQFGIQARFNLAE